MKKCLILPVLLLSLTGCATITNLNNMIEESTYAIHANREAIQCSSEVIRQNAQLIEQSNRAIEENRRHLETLSSGS